MLTKFLNRVSDLAYDDLICPKCHGIAVREESDLWCPHCHYSEPLRDYPEFSHYRDEQASETKAPPRPEPQPARSDLHHIQVDVNTLMNRLNTHLDNTKKVKGKSKYA